MELKEFANNKKIEILLNKYWEGKTSTEEERVLKDYFSQSKVAEHLQYVQPLFKALRDEEKTVLSDDFDQKLLQALKAKDRSSIHSRRFEMSKILKVAAALIVILLVTYMFQTQLRESNQPQVQQIKLGTFNDPKEAYEQVKKSLVLISSKMNQGKDYVKDLSKLNAGATLYNKRKTKNKN